MVEGQAAISQVILGFFNANQLLTFHVVVLEVGVGSTNEL